MLDIDLLGRCIDDILRVFRSETKVFIIFEVLIHRESISMTKNTQIIIKLIKTFQKSQRKSDHETRFWSSIIVPNVSELQNSNLLSSWKQSGVDIYDLKYSNHHQIDRNISEIPVET